MNKVAAIICAFNEERTIKNIVATVTDYFFDEVIVVNDGSTYKTGEILNSLQDLPALKCITLTENKGKGYAMATGVENSLSEIIVFIDADLSNIKEEHFSKLIIPVFNNEVDMVLGLATETLINYKINPFKSFTGERALIKKDILPILEDIKTSKFGVETLINIFYQAHGKKVKYVVLDGLKHSTKFEKTGQVQAIKEFVLEGHQIALSVYNNFNLITKIISRKIN